MHEDLLPLVMLRAGPIWVSLALHLYPLQAPFFFGFLYLCYVFIPFVAPWAHMHIMALGYDLAHAYDVSKA